MLRLNRLRDDVAVREARLQILHAQLKTCSHRLVRGTEAAMVKPETLAGVFVLGLVLGWLGGKPGPVSATRGRRVVSYLSGWPLRLLIIPAIAAYTRFSGASDE